MDYVAGHEHVRNKSPAGLVTFPRFREVFRYSEDGTDAARRFIDSSEALPHLERSPSSNCPYSPNLGEGGRVPAVFSHPPSLFPIPATAFQRYDRNIILPKTYNHSYVVKGCTRSFKSDVPPPGWTAFTHPEGAPFFFHGARAIFTDANLYNSSVHFAVEEYASIIESFIQSSPIEFPERVDLVLDLRPRESGKYECGYYFVDHCDQSLFWLEEYNVSGILDQVNVDFGPSHVGHEIQSQYWYHCELFPIRTIPSLLLDELKGTLIHALGDSLTSSVSTAPYNVKELRHMLYLANEMRVDKVSLGSACVFARLMGTFSHEKFLHLNGQQGARLSRNQSVHGRINQQTSILKWINPCMCYVPGTHLGALKDITVDHLVNKSTSSKLLKRLKGEWRESALFSALLLNANVYYLVAGGSFDRSGGSRWANQVSIIASIGSIIAGLLLVRQSATGTFNHFLAYRSVSTFGLEALAIMYSLPNTLLIWGLISFFVTLGSAYIDTTEIGSCVLMSVASIGVMSIFSWCISTSSETGAYTEPWIIRKWAAFTNDDQSSADGHEDCNRSPF